MIKANKEIKERLKAEKIPYWLLAHEMNVNENTIARLLRIELSATKKDEVISAINSISAQKESAC